MFAEADNEINGPTIDGKNAINIVRRRAFGAPLPDPAPSDLTPAQTATSGTLLTAIKEERSRELGFEGLRKYDLIRWGDFLSVMKDMEVEISNSNAPIAAVQAFKNVQPKHLLFPIPIRELTVNKDLVQNPLW